MRCSSGLCVSCRNFVAWSEPIVAGWPWLGSTAIGALMLIMGGCRDAPPTYPVMGSVYFRGQPAAHVDLVFYGANPAADGRLRPYATTDENGRFTVSTYGVHDGAPPGEYEVALSWKGPLRGRSPDQTDGMPERLPARYLNPATSGVRIQVDRGDNQLEAIHLTAK